jgi:hypothetical protein
MQWIYQRYSLSLVMLCHQAAHRPDDLSDDDNFESWLNYESEEESDDEEETKKLT